MQPLLPGEQIAGSIGFQVTELPDGSVLLLMDLVNAEGTEMQRFVRRASSRVEAARIAKETRDFILDRARKEDVQSARFIELPKT